MASVTFTSIMSLRLWATPKVTRPAPARSPPWQARAAAPVLPSEPASTRRWPKVPLWLSQGRGGSSSRSSRASASETLRLPGQVRRDAEVRLPQAAHVVPPRGHDLADFRPAAGHGDVRLDRHPQRLPGVGGQAAGEIHRQDLPLKVIDLAG